MAILHQLGKLKSTRKGAPRKKFRDNNLCKIPIFSRKAKTWSIDIRGCSSRNRVGWKGIQYSKSRPERWHFEFGEKEVGDEVINIGMAEAISSYVLIMSLPKPNAETQRNKVLPWPSQSDLADPTGCSTKPPIRCRPTGTRVMAI